MPFIDSKITVSVDDAKKEEIKCRLGALMASIGKSEAHLMVGIDDNYDLWMAGKKLEKGAYVEVSLLGDAGRAAYENMTKAICDMFAEILGIPGEGVYVKYHPVTDWGWNGANF
ncbi:MAG: hypothetical protein IJB70_11475 [Clostridia bacterium]|nr:hypothetical protein [Clostridia bacterium]